MVLGSMLRLGCRVRLLQIFSVKTRKGVRKAIAPASFVIIDITLCVYKIDPDEILKERLTFSLIKTDSYNLVILFF
ncbi:MAG: hypothetical protein BGO99_04505 [Nitrosospira sp. 56-18]|nr:hypothetical protein [Nitrosospira sp.]OJY14649.1 MAG: hypothetical protein BGO99_04505 [Nitrosospira sp. 56-18]